MVIQGFGNVGYHCARFLREEDDCRIIAVGEYDGGVYNPKGLDIDKLAKHRKYQRTILNFPGAKNLRDPREILEIECDILIPAALENQITLSNADRIRTRIVAEAANGPVTPGAEKLLRRKNVLTIPDIFLNSGGVTVSYFEWGKNLAHMRYGRMQRRLEQFKGENLVDFLERAGGKPVSRSVRNVLVHGAGEEDLVNSGLEETMIQAYEEVRNVLKRRRKVPSLRTAAYIVAIEKIAASYRELSIFP